MEVIVTWQVPDLAPQFLVDLLHKIWTCFEINTSRVEVFGNLRMSFGAVLKSKKLVKAFGDEVFTVFTSKLTINLADPIEKEILRNLGTLEL